MQLQLTHVSKHYPSPRGAVMALADVTFTVEQGEFIALVGPSGVASPLCCGSWPGC
jgi:NitT/TauT family transport system ATP-binding protein